MSRKFYAVNRETGERWTPKKADHIIKQYLVMYDSGYLAVVTEHYGGSDITSLDNKKWTKVMQGDTPPETKHI